jgi:hypothetical protein
MALTFLEQARRLMPWMPADLLAVYAQAWTESGDPNMALATVRQSAAYKTYFKNNVREDGTLRYSEQDYMAVLDGYRQNLAARGLNPSMFEDRLHDWIGLDISVQEHDQRIDEWDQYLRNWGPEGTNGYTTSIQWYAQNYGLTDMTDQAVLASVLDPNLGQDIVRRRIRASQIGGAAAAYGFNRTVESVNRLANLGFGGDGKDPLEFYATARERLPTMDALASRFYDAQGGIGIEGFESAFAAGDAGTRQRIQRAQAAEVSSFSRRGTADTDEEGRVTGLRQR